MVPNASANAKGPWWRYVDWKLFVPLLVLGVLLHYYYPPGWWLGELVRGHLSVAVMIASVLGITVDRTAKDKLLRDVSSDIWAHLMGRDLPSEMKGFIQDALLNTKLVCTRLELRYQLEKRATDGRLNVYVEIKRHIQNYSTTNVSMPLYETIFISEEPRFLSVTCRMENGRDVVWTEADGSNDVLELKTERGAKTARVRKPVRLTPYGTKGSRIVLTWKHAIVRDQTGTDISAFNMPTVSAELSLNKPLPDLEFTVDRQPKPVGDCWRMDEVVWSGGFYRVRWEPRRGD